MSKRSVENELDDLGNRVLGDLDADERIRMVMKAEHEGREEHLQRLNETVPTRTYEVTDLEYRDGIQTCFLISSHVSHRLRAAYRRILQYGNGRDLHVALLMLNTALGFDRDNEPEELAERYTELWDETDLSLGTDAEPWRDSLPSVSLLAYPPDSEAFDFEDGDELTDLFHEARFYDLKLTTAVLDFYTVFHGARRLSEEVIGVSFDEFVGFTPIKEKGTPDDLEITEEVCRNILSAHDENLEYAARVASEADEEVQTDEVLEVHADAWVEGLLGALAHGDSDSFPFDFDTEASQTPT